EQNIAARQANDLSESERETLLELLQQQVERHPDRLAGPNALMRLAEYKVDGAAQVLFRSAENAPARQLEPGVAHRILQLGKGEPGLADAARKTLGELGGKTGTRVGKAAEQALKGWK